MCWKGSGIEENRDRRRKGEGEREKRDEEEKKKEERAKKLNGMIIQEKEMGDVGIRKEGKIGGQLWTRSCRYNEQRPERRGGKGREIREKEVKELEEPS